ncbi:MAG: hypothetical protein LBQ46_04800 [Treponema sp.]|nr:hypothetical protein [Treponema sp.]
MSRALITRGGGTPAAVNRFFTAYHAQFAFNINAHGMGFNFFRRLKHH